jgi:hypothetical protein
MGERDGMQEMEQNSSPSIVCDAAVVYASQK